MTSAFFKVCRHVISGNPSGWGFATKPVSSCRGNWSMGMRDTLPAQRGRRRRWYCSTAAIPRHLPARSPKRPSARTAFRRLGGYCWPAVDSLPSSPGSQPPGLCFPTKTNATIPRKKIQGTTRMVYSAQVQAASPSAKQLGLMLHVYFLF